MGDNNDLDDLFNCRDQIEKILTEIDSILKTRFANEYETAYQHWLPQIKTALRDNTQWLPRGQFTMDYTLKRINDNMNSSLEKGVSKYI